MANPLYRARLKPGLAERVDEYGEQHGLDDPDAIRELLLRGLEAEKEPGSLEAIASKVALALAVGALVVAPLGIAWPEFWFVAIFYLAAAAVAEAYAQGVRWRPSIPRPWRREA